MPRLALALAAVCSAALAAPAAAGAVGFQSPSRNIGCVMDSSFVRCDIRERTWSPPAKPSSCELDFGQGLSVGRSGRGRFVCAGDTVLGNGRRLAFGTSIRRGRMRCTSSQSGVRCTNRDNGHGFLISRARARRF